MNPYADSILHLPTEPSTLVNLATETPHLISALGSYTCSKNLLPIKNPLPPFQSGCASTKFSLYSFQYVRREWCRTAELLPSRSISLSSIREREDQPCLKRLPPRRPSRSHLPLEHFLHRTSIQPLSVSFNTKNL